MIPPPVLATISFAMDKPLKPHSYSPAKAEKILQELLWPNGMICPYCRNSDPERFGPCGKRKHVHRCLECRRQFRWRHGTILEGSTLPADIWMLAFWQVANRPNINGVWLAELIDISPRGGRDVLARILAAAKAVNFDWPTLPPDERALALAKAVIRARKPVVREAAKTLKPPNNRRWHRAERRP